MFRSNCLIRCICLLLMSVSTIPANWAQTMGPGGGTISDLIVNGRYIFANTLDGVYRTTIDGTSWSKKNNGLTMRNNNALFAAGGIVFAQNYDGLYRSSNNGESWKKVQPGIPDQGIKTIVSNGVNLFAGTSKGVFLSSDGGVNWKEILSGSEIPIAVDGEAIFAAEGNILLRSSDNGEHWIESGLKGKYIRILGANNGIILAHTSNDEIYRSTDNGISWVCTDSGTTHKAKLIKSFIFYGDTVVGAGNNSIHRSIDRGISWTSYQPDIPPFDNISFTACSSTFFIGTWYGGVFRSSDFGSTWTVFNTGLTSNDIRCLISDANTVYALTFSINTPLFSSMGIVSTIDNGKTWNDLGLSFPDSGISISAFAVNGGTFFIGASSRGLFRSIDSGKNWTRITHFDNCRITDLATDKSTLFTVLKDSAFIYRSINNGQTWEKLDALLPCSLVRDIQIQDSTIYVVSGMGGPEVATGGLFRSIDFGRTWSRINSGLPGDLFITSMAISGKLIFISTLRNKILLSTNKGESWVFVGNEISDEYLRSITATTTGLFVGGQYSSVWYRPIEEIIGVNNRKIQSKTQNATGFNSGIIAHSATRISVRLSLSQRELVCVSLFDLAGHVVENMVNKRLEPGLHEFPIATKTLTTGCYFICITTGSDMYTKRVPVFY